MQSQPGVLFYSEMRLRLLVIIVYLPAFAPTCTLFKEKDSSSIRSLSLSLPPHTKEAIIHKNRDNVSSALLFHPAMR